jgi:sulfofructose kinase
LCEADIVFFSAGGLKLATGLDEPVDGARQVLELGPKQIIVTQGAKGAYGVTRGEVIFSPAFHVDVVDTTGAGDCFHGAYLSGELHGVPLAPRLRFANAAAALSVQKMGAREALPSRADVEAFLSDQLKP